MYSKPMCPAIKNNSAALQSESSLSQDIAIFLQDISKTYKLYSRPLHRVFEALVPSLDGKYHQKFHALRHISFSIEKGQTVGIIGKNGSGKSTLLQIICEILKPSGGEVKIDGRISALLELGAGFNPEFTGRENVFLNGSILGVSSKEMAKCLDDILEFADIGSFIDQPVKTYSSGMYVRLAFAVAINVKPDILIVDEALSVGDTAFQAKCFAKFKEFQEKGVTILFVTHSMDLITRYCDNAILLENGEIITSGAAKDVVDEYNRRIVNCSENDAQPTNATVSKIDKPEEEPLAVENNAEVTSTDQKQILCHMKESELAYQLNPKENRYGNGKAEIIEMGIDSLESKPQYSFVHGQRYRFWFKTLFHSELNDPITAFTIKDVKGFDITGTNTLFKNIQVGKVQKGDLILTEFDHKMMLNPGGYLLSFGCAGFEEGEYVVYDRRYDTITFEVISENSSVGFFDLGSTIQISRLEKQ